MPGVTATLGQRLTAQERRVLRWVAHGRTAREIGAKLGIAESTVRTYLFRIGVKLGSRNKAHSVTLGFVKGEITLPRAGA